MLLGVTNEVDMGPPWVHCPEPIWILFYVGGVYMFSDLHIRVIAPSCFARMVAVSPNRVNPQTGSVLMVISEMSYRFVDLILKR